MSIQRNWSILRTATLAVSFVAFLAAAPAQAVDPGVLCATAKQKAAAKKLSDKVKCHGKALKKGEPVSAECLSKAELKFEESFSKAEAKGGCATTGDKAAIESLIDETLADLLAALPTVPPSACEALNPTVCQDCLECVGEGDYCATEISACQAECSSFAACFYFCNSDTCRDNCRTSYPTGAAQWLAIYQCGAAECDAVCPTICGDTQCTGDETSSNCAVDCGCAAVCGDGTCDPDCEDATSCLVDCGCTAVCGDGTCDDCEDFIDCPADCGGPPEACGNGIVEAGEECDASSCPSGYQCGGDCVCHLVPPAWTCDPAFYGTTDGCDCGCGALDTDCADATLSSCQYCDNVGSCSPNACPGLIDPANNSQCIIP